MLYHYTRQYTMMGEFPKQLFKSFSSCSNRLTEILFECHNLTSVLGIFVRREVFRYEFLG